MLPWLSSIGATHCNVEAVKQYFDHIAPSAVRLPQPHDCDDDGVVGGYSGAGFSLAARLALSVRALLDTLRGHWKSG